jgi:hypothetical protein
MVATEGDDMTFTAEADRLSLGSMLGRALAFARRRWLELLALVICIDWGPRVILTLTGVGRYALGSHDEGAFLASAVQSAVLEFCSLLMLASVIAVGLGNSRRPVSPPAAITQVLQRLPALAPWWLLCAVPNAITVWLRWSVGSPAEMRATYYWREFGDATYGIALSCALGLFSLVVLAEGLGGLAALRRTLGLMAGRRGAVFIVAFATKAIGLVINLATPYLAVLAVSLGLGRDYQATYYPASFTVSFVSEATAVVANLVYVQLYLELARAHDGVAPGELHEVFA